MTRPCPLRLLRLHRPTKAAPVQEAAEPAADENTGAAPVAEVREESPAEVVEGGYSPSMTVDEIGRPDDLGGGFEHHCRCGNVPWSDAGRRSADRRPASLRWYMLGCKEASNVLKAGAKLVLDSLAMPKSA